MKYTEKKRYQIALRRLYSGNAPSKEILNLLGTDKDGFITHVNRYLLDGMTIENFGKIWGLDHIVPVDLFDFSKEEDLRLCYNFNNIMPMFNSDNRLKGASVHFSLLKLQSMYTNEYIEQLKAKTNEEIIRVYQKYLLPLS
jgi:hypothetical protein